MATDSFTPPIKEKTLTIIHNIYDYKTGYQHSITIIDRHDNIAESKKVDYKTMARLGSYVATTAYHSDFPEIFCISVPTYFEVRKRTNKGIKSCLKLVD